MNHENVFFLQNLNSEQINTRNVTPFIPEGVGKYIHYIKTIKDNFIL